jgi:hypothetical protein
LGAIDERTTGRVETTKVETRIVFETLYIYIKKEEIKTVHAKYEKEQ